VHPLLLLLLLLLEVLYSVEVELLSKGGNYRATSTMKLLVYTTLLTIWLGTTDGFFVASSVRASRSRVARSVGDMPIENMKAQEIKAELNMRGVSWEGCYDKTDLQRLLRESRMNGKSDPKILEQFNRQVL